MNKGFTLIELLVVISLIGLLAGIVLVGLKGAKDRAKAAKIQQEIDQITKLMYIFQADHGELPPLGDNCSACSNPCNSSWTVVMDALVNGGYLKPDKRIDKDPWGNYLCYDDNDNICCGGCSPIYSMGPNGVNDSWFNCPRDNGCPQSICKDDVGEILPFGDRSYPW